MATRQPAGWSLEGRLQGQEDEDGDEHGQRDGHGPAQDDLLQHGEGDGGGLGSHELLDDADAHHETLKQ